jgi:DNA-binding MurR/RpiR family transcriptional regulator
VSNNQRVESGESNVSSNAISSITSSYSNYISKINTTITLEEVTRLAESIIHSNRVKIFGINRTGFSANQLRYRLSKIGFDAEALTDTVLMRDVSNNLGRNDLCIIFSIKGSPAMYSDIVKTLKENRCKVILIAMNPGTPLKKDCDTVIMLPYISKMSEIFFLDDQVIFFVFIEILLSELARLSKE